jgi:Phosphodiester glycosidase
MKKLHLRAWRCALLLAVAFGALSVGASVCWNCRQRQPPTDIFEGITYGREFLATTEEGGGVIHWVRIELTAPGIELYVTPLDPSAVAQGWQYRLRWIGDVVSREHLAVAINGTYFASQSPWWIRMSGDLATSVETLVADHVVSHSSPGTYLLWFNDQLTPRMGRTRPPAAADLAQARWGIGARAVWLSDGRVVPGTDRAPGARTAIAIDPQPKVLFLAVGPNVSARLLLEKLAGLGAKDGMSLDGGTSSSMAIGEGAAGVQPGVLWGGWRPVATFFGVRARPIRR